MKLSKDGESYEIRDAEHLLQLPL